MKGLSLLLANAVLPWVLLIAIGGVLAVATALLFFLWQNEKKMAVGVGALLDAVYSVDIAEKEAEEEIEDDDAFEEEDEKTEEDFEREPFEEMPTELPIEKKEPENGEANASESAVQVYADKLAKARRKLKRLETQVKEVKSLRERIKIAEAEKEEAEGKLKTMEMEMQKLQKEYAEYKETQEKLLEKARVEAGKAKEELLQSFKDKQDDLQKRYDELLKKYETLQQEGNDKDEVAAKMYANIMKLRSVLTDVKKALVRLSDVENLDNMRQTMSELVDKISAVFESEN